MTPAAEVVPPLVLTFTVTCDEPVRLESAPDTAVIVAVSVDETVAGAVYTPSEVIVPYTEVPPVIPLTCQETAVLAVLVTVALNT